MTTVQYILVIIAVVIMVVGLFMIIRGLRSRQNSTVQPPAIAEKNGIPIVPRHERYEDTDDIVDKLLDQGHKDDDTITASEPQAAVNTDINENHAESLSSRTPSYVTDDSSAEYANEHERDLGKAWQEQQQLEDKHLFDSASELIEDDQLNVHRHEPTIQELSAHESTSHDAIEQQSLHDSSQANSPTHREEDSDDVFSNFASATENLMPAIKTAEEPEFNDNSPVLDHHLLEAANHDQNSPLNNAEENINITITPYNAEEVIHGSTVLSLVEQYGLKYGAMNMFHRYENKNGTGILWFSMMGITDEGIAPFDLNSLPTATFKGLVLFLSLPHPKALQGFDSMMSIVGLIAKQLEAQVLDDNNQPLTRERRQQLRNQVQEYHTGNR